MENQEGEERIIKVNIETQMKSAYIDYSMSVIVGRALPDVRDGLKPVHRRVLYGMLDLGVLSNRSYKKSARIVGEVLGKYHPHGDTSVYDAMVRMAQEWSLRYPLVDGQGNFGSIDGDSPAAMRYTEARLQKIAEEMLSDINKDTVDFQNNFDDSLQEPMVLPARIPNLLVNGASGIAVGMATNMPPHNLSEVVDGTIAYIDNKEISVNELMKFIKAPDFPTGGFIYGYEGVKEAFESGRGRIVMRGESKIEINHSHETIIFNSIPYQVNKADLIKKAADLVNDKKIEGISDIRDESDRNGMRIVFDLKRDAITNVVLNKLYQLTPLQSSFSVNNICLVNGRPMLLNIKQLIHYFVEHRHDVVLRRTKFELREAEKRAHILAGLLIALDHLDEVIALIRATKTPEEARIKLIERFELSEIQARAILDMRLQRLTGLERDKIRNEYEELLKMIEYYNLVINNVDMRMEIIKKELLDIKESYGDERKTQIVYSASDFRIEDTIADEDVVITISHMGYIKRTPLTEYRRQNRGGRGAKGSNIRDEDFLEYMYVASMHNYMLFFTEKGKVFWMRVYEIPEGGKNSKGRAIQNLINIEPDDKIKAFKNLKNLKDEEYINNNYIILCTRKGIIKKTSLEAYSRPRQNGINAITIREGDQLLEARLTNGNNEVLLALRSGRAIRFNESTVRPMGRMASGVKGITLASDKDEVIGMICPPDDSADILVVSENGYGKRSKLEDYRITNRGGKGVKTINVTEKTGDLISIEAVTDNDDLMIINRSGLIIRLGIANLRVMGRATQGVRLITLRGDDSIAAVTKVEVEAEEVLGPDEENGDISDNSALDNTAEFTALDVPTDDSVISTEDENEADDSTDEENNDEIGPEFV
ncbi:MAG: DNA gyrase subunit A [Lentimicrobiaceae bacterium]|nr:DNA gyrase subunit A [Lentimicrobiaceae bacterium]MDD4596936.1 DNA gyrase subunit A [Lentimicrobiaceae bacterium]